MLRDERPEQIDDGFVPEPERRRLAVGERVARPLEGVEQHRILRGRARAEAVSYPERAQHRQLAPALAPVHGTYRSVGPDERQHARAHAAPATVVTEDVGDHA